MDKEYVIQCAVRGCIPPKSGRRKLCPFTIEDIKENSRQDLKSISGNAFKKCFDDRIIRWHECIISGAAYFKGDKLNLDE